MPFKRYYLESLPLSFVFHLVLLVYSQKAWFSSCKEFPFIKLYLNGALLVILGCTLKTGYYFFLFWFFPVERKTYWLVLESLTCWNSYMCNLQGWVILSDKMGTIEMARTLATQVRWEARVIDLQNGSDQRLLVCQKPFVKK